MSTAQAEPEVVPQDSPAKSNIIADMLNKRKDEQDPVTQLRSYGDRLDSMINNTDVGEYLVDDLMTAWKELNPTAGNDEFSHLKTQLSQAVNSPEPESAIEGFKQDLLIAKMRQLGISDDQDQPPVGESYKAKIDKYRRLIKESTVVSPTKTLREKLGLPA